MSDFETRVKETLHRRGAPDEEALERLIGYVAVLPPRRTNRLRNLSLAASIVMLLGVVLLALPREANIGTTLASPSTGAAVPSGHVSSPSAGASLTDNTRVTCGGQMTFPASGLDAPLGAEKASGPEFDALRAAFALYAGPFPDAPDWSWRMAGRDSSGATFMAKPEGFGASEWISIELAASPGGWHPTGIGVCLPHVVLSAEFGPATWGLDPAFPPPETASTVLHVLVSERACHGFEPATGRMSAPSVVYTAESVTVTIGVRPLGGASRCPLPPGTPALVQLAEPLGDRTLLDGGPYPPTPPSSPRSVLPIDPSIVPISIKDHSAEAEAAFQACNVEQLGFETVSGMGLVSSAQNLTRYAPFVGTEPQLKMAGSVWLIQFKGDIPMPTSGESWVDPVCIKAAGDSGYFAVNGGKSMSNGKFLPPLPPQSPPSFRLPPLQP